MPESLDKQRPRMEWHCQIDPGLRRLLLDCGAPPSVDNDLTRMGIFSVDQLLKMNEVELSECDFPLGVKLQLRVIRDQRRNEASAAAAAGTRILTPSATPASKPCLQKVYCCVCL